MEQLEVENLIDKKLKEKFRRRSIIEAELQITEKRLQTVLALFVVFGILLPIYITYTAKSDVNEAIKNMKEEFSRLAATQLRKPIIDCTVNGRSLRGSLVTLVNGAFSFQYFELKNIGDAPANNIRVRLLFGANEKISRSQQASVWITRDDLIKDEPAFPNVLYYKYFESPSPRIKLQPGAFGAGGGGTEPYGEILEKLDPTESIRIFVHDLHNYFLELQSAKGDFYVPAILKVYYGQPEPTTIHFTLVVKSE